MHFSILIERKEILQNLSLGYDLLKQTKLSFFSFFWDFLLYKDVREHLKK